MDSIIGFYMLLFAVAFLYSSVGHGGASGYLALMALFSVTPEVMKPTALMLNLFVSITAFVQYYRGRYFLWKIFFPIAVASVPLAFLGGRISVDPTVYKRILGIFLLLPIGRFLFFKDMEVVHTRKNRTGLSLVVGASIGLLSGLIGIGGGIILSPVLLLLAWVNQKQAAAISALFIFVNSASGLLGQLTQGVHFSPDMYTYVGIAFAGGLCGSYFGAIRFGQSVIKYMLAFVLAIASFKLFLLSD